MNKTNKRREILKFMAAVPFAGALSFAAGEQP